MHAHEFAMNTYGSLASALSGIPIVTTVLASYYWKHLRRRMAYRFVSRHRKWWQCQKTLHVFFARRWELGLTDSDDLQWHRNRLILP
jgi:hypothetical protein